MAHQDPIQVDAHHEGERPVVLTPADEDRFVKTCDWVVEATKLGNSRDVWRDELRSMLTHVRRWAREHAPRVKRCLAAPRDAQIVIYVVPRSGRFDFDLTETITDLDIELSEKFRACPCDVLQMPDKASNELNPPSRHPFAILLYGDEAAASEQVAPQP